MTQPTETPSPRAPQAPVRPPAPAPRPPPRPPDRGQPFSRSSRHRGQSNRRNKG